MRNYLIFNGHRSEEFGLYISGGGTFGAPKRKYDTFTVPGRNGTLRIDCGTFDNVSVTYKCAIVRNFAENAAALREWLLSASGYCRLEDTYHPGEYRLAQYSGGVDFSDFTQLLRAASTTLVFECKPQRFLKSGENPISNPANVFNPTAFPSKPIINFKTVTTSGSITIGECLITFDSLTVGDVISIDAETMDAVGKSGGNVNKSITIRGEIALSPHVCSPVASDGIEDFTIVPRWWTL